MNANSTPQPAPPGTPPVPSIDLVAGDPPVPITVWRTARDERDVSRSIPARLAYRLVAAYSRPGEAVVDLSDGHALTQVALTGGRVHHKGWFTDAASLIVGPPTLSDSTVQNDEGTDPGDAVDAVAIAAWFGDDLTHPDTTQTAPEPADTADTADPPGGLRAALVVANWPLDPSDTINTVRLAWLLAACRRLLRRGGCLVLVVGVPAGLIATPEDFTPVVAAAARAGMGYLQHIVAVAAGVDGERFTYHASDEELLALQHARAGEQFFVHVTVHADLLVFTPKAGEPRD